MTVKKENNYNIKIFLSQEEFKKYFNMLQIVSFSNNILENYTEASIKKAVYELLGDLKKSSMLTVNLKPKSIKLKSCKDGYGIEVYFAPKKSIHFKALQEYRIIFKNAEQMIEFVLQNINIFCIIPQCTLYKYKNFQAIIQCNPKNLEYLSNYAFICNNSVYISYLKEYGYVICEQKNIDRFITAFESH